MTSDGLLLHIAAARAAAVENLMLECTFRKVRVSKQVEVMSSSAPDSLGAFCILEFGTAWHRDACHVSYYVWIIDGAKRGIPPRF